VQEAILRGTWQGQKYPKISEELHRSEGHVREIASELSKILSEVLGKEVNKSNFRSALQRSHFSLILYAPLKKNVNINNVNVCANTVQSPAVPKERSPSTPIAENTQPQIHQDLRDAPDISSFYGRTSELATLQQWIVQDRARLVAILGISGIGKTAIALHLLPQIQH
jgi:ATP-dependent Clp protease ATP-binding subunit ClpA